MAEDKDSNDKSLSRYKPGNVGPDGDYLVGKGRPPKHTRFAAGDGRRRGRRPKGQKNFDTEFQEEAKRKVTIREGGKERKVTKQRSVIIRAFDNAGSKGQNQAIQNIFNQAQKIAERKSPTGHGLDPDEEALIEAWLDQQVAERMAGDKPGDPETPLYADDKASDPNQSDRGDD